MRRLFSLRGKMLLFAFGIVLVLMGVTLVAIHRLVVGQVSRQVAADLERTRSVFETFMRERSLWLRSQCGVVAEDPRFTATLDIESPDFDYQARTVVREASRFQNIIGSDLFVVTDREGRVLTRMVIASDPAGSLDGLPTLGHALAGRPAAAQWTPPAAAPGPLYVGTVPFLEGGDIGGTVSVGFLFEVDTERLLDDLAITTQGPDGGAGAWRNRGGTAVARDMLKAFGADFAAVTDAEGRTLGMSVRTASFGEDQSSVPRVEAALMGHETVGMQVESGTIVQMVVVPVWSGDAVIGTLASGFRIDDRVAGDLREMMHSHVSFARDGRIVASTWPEAVRRSAETQMDAAPRVEGEPFEMTLGGETFLTLVGPLRDLRGTESGRYLIQISLDEATAFLTEIERVLVVLGFCVLIAAGVISLVGSSRITRPILALVEGTRRLASGDLDERIPVETRDEVGELAASFNDMAEALTDSRDALTQSERRYRDLFDNAQDIVYTTDTSMRIISVNRAGQALLGFTAEELAGRRLYDLFRDEDAERLRRLDSGLRESEPRPAVEATIRGKGGRETTLEIVSRWMVEQGRVVGVHGLGRDVSQRREREAATIRFREQLHQAEKLRALGEMAAGVAHNFNNLLTGVMGYAEVMKLQGELPDSVARNADKIVEAAHRCAAIIRRIQTFGRPMDAAELTRVHLNRVVQETVEITRPKWKAGPEREGRAVELVLALGEIEPIRSSVSVWEEILSNLIFNAVDAMPNGGRITVSTSMEAERVLLAVEDTGTGMDEETKRRVFEPFFSTKGPDRGTGLGLSTVWALVSAQGGTVKIDSEPGQGTRFEFRLAAEREGDDVAAGDSADALPGDLRVLVVDDEAPLRELIPTLLQGHQVVMAATGEEALRKLLDAPFDILLTDWVMSGMSGIELAERAKSTRPELKVILMTGWEFSASNVEGSDVIDTVLAKPFDSARLREAIGETMSEADARPS